MKNLIYGGVEYKNFVIDKSGYIKNLKTNHTYKFSKDAQGYLAVYLPLGKRGRVKGIKVHKAVAETLFQTKKIAKLSTIRIETKEILALIILNG